MRMAAKSAAEAARPSTGISCRITVRIDQALIIFAALFRVAQDLEG
jgi:hypothetical protein